MMYATFRKTGILVFILFLISNAAEAQEEFYWSSFNAATDRFDTLPAHCGMVASSFLRGPGALPPAGAFTPTRFIARSFGSTGYPEAVGNGDYVYFYINTDSGTSMTISSFQFEVSKSETVEEAKFVLDFGLASTGFAFTPIDSFSVLGAAPVLVTVLPSGGFTLPAGDSAVFRLVVVNDLGHGLRTIRLDGRSDADNGCAFTATFDTDTVPAAISADITHFCYDGEIVPVTISLTGPPFGTAYFRNGTAEMTAALDSSGSAIYIYEAELENTPRTFYLDSVTGGCNVVTSLGLSEITVTADTVSRTALYGFVCDSTIYEYNGLTYKELPPGTDNPPVVYTINTDQFAPGVDTLMLSDTFTSSRFCDSILVIHLTRYPKPQLSITPATESSICFGDTLSMSVTSASDSTVAYLWSPATGLNVDTGATVKASPVATTTYTIIGISEKGCSDTASVLVTVKPAPVLATETVQGCGRVEYEGKTYTTSEIVTQVYTGIDGCDSFIRQVSIVVIPEIRDTILATICEGEVMELNGKVYAEPGVYADTFVAGNGCDSAIVLMLQVSPLPEILITAESHTGAVCVHDTFYLSASGAAAYSWFYDGGNIIEDGDRAGIVLSAYHNEVVVWGTNEQGCRDSAGAVISAEPCCELFMPNAFSPNGDGLNDRFGAVGYGTPAQYQLQVFDRWGRRVFVCFRVQDGWDGRVGDKPADLGVYFYKVTGYCVNGQPLSKQGELILLR